MDEKEPVIKRNIADTLSAAEKDLLDRDEPAPAAAATVTDEGKTEPANPSALPDWALKALPEDAQFKPPAGMVLHFLKCRADLTKNGMAGRGDRVLVLWELSVGDERNAKARTFGESARTYEEMAKMMIRAYDGVRVDPGKPDQIEKLWEEIGPRYRGMLILWYLRSHQLGDEDRLRFFVKDVASRSMG